MTYETIDFQKPFTDNLNSIVVQNRINQYGRCQIGSKIFGSAMSFHHIKSSFVLAQFVNHNGSIDFYPGQIQYFFTYTVNLADKSVDYILAYIRWYRPVNSVEIRFHFSINETETCDVEL